MSLLDHRWYCPTPRGGRVLRGGRGLRRTGLRAAWLAPDGIASCVAFSAVAGRESPLRGRAGRESPLRGKMTHATRDSVRSAHATAKAIRFRPRNPRNSQSRLESARDRPAPDGIPLCVAPGEHILPANHDSVWAGPLRADSRMPRRLRHLGPVFPSKCRTLRATSKNDPQDATFRWSRRAASGVRHAASGMRGAACGVGHAGRSVRHAGRNVRRWASDVRAAASDVRAAASGVRHTGHGVRGAASAVWAAPHALELTAALPADRRLESATVFCRGGL